MLLQFVDPKPGRSPLELAHHLSNRLYGVRANVVQSGDGTFPHTFCIAPTVGDLLSVSLAHLHDDQYHLVFRDVVNGIDMRDFMTIFFAHYLDFHIVLARPS